MFDCFLIGNLLQELFRGFLKKVPEAVSEEPHRVPKLGAVVRSTVVSVPAWWGWRDLGSCGAGRFFTWIGANGLSTDLANGQCEYPRHELYKVSKCQFNFIHAGFR